MEKQVEHKRGLEEQRRGEDIPGHHQRGGIRYCPSNPCAASLLEANELRRSRQEEEDEEGRRRRWLAEEVEEGRR